MQVQVFGQPALGEFKGLGALPEGTIVIDDLSAVLRIQTRTRKFYVNFKPKHQHPHYQASTDRGVTVPIMALNARAAIASAKAQGVHKMGDYPGVKSFDWFVAE
jgi:hypothetical protein